MSLSFCVIGKVNIPYARNLVINISEDYLAILNSIPGLRPHVEEFPLSQKNVEVTLYFSQKNREESYYPYICVAGNVKGNLDYCTIEKTRSNYRDCYLETYEEAVERLKNGNVVGESEMRRR